MPSYAPRLIVAILTAFLLFLTAGCSADAKKERHLKNADEYFAQGDYAKAELEYINVLQIATADPHSVARLAIIYFDQARLGRVYPFLTKAKELDPENLDIRSRLAVFFIGMGKRAEAREEALFVLARRPDDPEAALVFADCATSEVEIQDARNQLRQLPGSAQESAPVLTALGILEYRQRRFEEARDFFSRAQQKTPGFAAALLGEANVHLAKRELAEAEAKFVAAAAAAAPRSPRRLQYAKFKIAHGAIAEAKKFLTEVTTQTPDFVSPWIMLADLSASEGKFDESLASLQQALTRDANHPEAILLSGRVRILNGERDKAVAELERATKTYPLSPQLHHQLAVAYLASSDETKASRAAARAVSLAPGFLDAVVLQAELHLRQKNHGPAIIALRQAIEQYPDAPAPQLLLAQAMRDQGNLDDALGIYRRLEQLRPDDPKVQLLIGTTLLQKRQRTEARAAFDRASRLAPDYFPAVEQQVNLDLDERNFASARERTEAIMARHPNVGPLHLLLAKVHLAAGDNEAAEKVLIGLQKIQPDLPTTYFLLARIYTAARKSDQAIANFEEASKRNPRDVHALMSIGILQETQKNFTAARDAYLKVLAIMPQFTPALNNLAYLYAEHLGEIDKALELAQQARTARPDQPHITDTLGWIHYRKRDFTRAAVLLAEAATQLPDQPEIQYHHGMAQYTLGNEAAATAALHTALTAPAGSAFEAGARAALAILEIDPETAGPAERAILEQATATDNSALAWTKLGIVQRRSGAVRDAQKSLEAALRENPQQVRASLELVTLLHEQKQTAEALVLAKSMRKLDAPDPGVAFTLGRVALEGGDFLWAASLLADAALGKPDNPEAAYWYAMAAYATGRIELAQEELKRALGLNPVFAQASAAREYLKLMEVTPVDGADEQRAYVETVLRTQPKHPAALAAAGALAQSRGDHESARQAYETLLGAYPEFVPGMRHLTISVSNGPDLPANAIDRANRARQAFPDDAELAKALGILLCRDKNYGRALNVLRESFRQRPSDPQVPYYMGLAEAGLNNLGASRDALEKALELGLEGVEADTARRLLAGRS